MTGKNFLILAIIILIFISCSDVDKFSDEKKWIILLNGISEKLNANKFSLYADLRLENSEQISWDLAKDYFEYCFWIIDSDTIRSTRYPYEGTGYGEHFAKLVLIDIYGDTISDSLYFSMNEPLKIELLSPINNFSNFSKEDTLKFTYKISGVDSWEKEQVFLYVSSDKNSLWEEENILEDNMLKPLGDIYYWGVKAWTEQDSAFSGTRCIGKYCGD